MRRVPASRPWHFWVVELVAAFFMLIGTYDFVNVAAKNSTYLDDMYTSQGVQYFMDYPPALLLLFGLHIFSGIAALLVALWNTKVAMNLAVLSATADALLIFITVVFRHRIEAIGLAPTLQDTAVCVGLFTLAGYYRWLSAK